MWCSGALQEYAANVRALHKSLLSVFQDCLQGRRTRFLAQAHTAGQVHHALCTVVWQEKGGFNGNLWVLTWTGNRRGVIVFVNGSQLLGATSRQHLPFRSFPLPVRPPGLFTSLCRPGRYERWCRQARGGTGLRTVPFVQCSDPGPRRRFAYYTNRDSGDDWPCAVSVEQIGRGA